MITANEIKTGFDNSSPDTAEFIAQCQIFITKETNKVEHDKFLIQFLLDAMKIAKEKEDMVLTAYEYSRKIF